MIVHYIPEARFDEVGAVTIWKGAPDIFQNLAVEINVVLGEIAITELFRQDLPGSFGGAPEGKERSNLVCVGEPGAVDKLDGSLLDQPYFSGFCCCEQLRALSLLSSLQVVPPLRQDFIMHVLEKGPDPLCIVVLDRENTFSRMFEGD